MHKLTNRDSKDQSSNFRQQSATDEILHQYFISSYFRNSLGIPQLRKRFRRQGKPKSFSSPPLAYAASDSKADSQCVPHLMDMNQVGGCAPQNVYIKNTFFSHVSKIPLSNVQEESIVDNEHQSKFHSKNKDKDSNNTLNPPSNAKGFSLLRKSNKNHPAGENVMLKFNNPYSTGKVIFDMDELMQENPNNASVIKNEDEDEKDPNSFAADTCSNATKPSTSIPIIVIQRASVIEPSTSPYRLPTIEEPDVICNEVNKRARLNICEDNNKKRDVPMNLCKDIEKIRNNNLKPLEKDFRHDIRGATSLTKPDVVHDTSVSGPISDDRSEVYTETIPNVDEEKFTLLSTLLNESTTSIDIKIPPPTHYNATDPAAARLDDSPTDTSFDVLSSRAQQHSNHLEAMDYSRLIEDIEHSIRERDKLEKEKENTDAVVAEEGDLVQNKSLEGTKTLREGRNANNTIAQMDNSYLTEQGAGGMLANDNGNGNNNDNDNNNDDDRESYYDDNEKLTAGVPIIQYQLTTYSVTSVSVSDTTVEKVNVNEVTSDNTNRDANIYYTPSPLDMEMRESHEENYEMPLKPPPPPKSLTDILISSGQSDVANQTLAARRANNIPDLEVPKSPTRKFAFKGIRKNKISGPVLVSSTSNVKSLPIIHLNRQEKLKALNKRHIDVGLANSIKKIKEVFTIDESKRAVKISDPEVLMTPSLCKYFSEETLRQRFNIDIPAETYNKDPMNENLHGQFKHRLVVTNATEQDECMKDYETPDEDQTDNDVLHMNTQQSSAPTENLYNLEAIKSHLNTIREYSSDNKKGKTAENEHFVADQHWHITNNSKRDESFPQENAVTAGQYYAGSIPTSPTNLNFSFQDTSEMKIPQNQHTDSIKNEPDRHLQKFESTIASKIFSMLNNFTDRNTAAKHEIQVSARPDSLTRGQQDHEADVNNNVNTKKRYSVQNTPIDINLLGATQVSSGGMTHDYGDVDNDARCVPVSISSEGRKWLLEQCVGDSKDATTENTEQVTSESFDGDNYSDNQQVRSSLGSVDSESLYDLYRYSSTSSLLKQAVEDEAQKNLQQSQEDKSPVGEDKQAETSDIWQVVDGLRLNSSPSRFRVRDSADYKRNGRYISKGYEDISNLYGNGNGNDTFVITQSSLNYKTTDVNKPLPPTLDAMSTDSLLSSIGAIYGVR